MSEQRQPTPAGQVERKHAITYAQMAAETGRTLASLAGQLASPVTADSADGLAAVASRCAKEVATLATMLDALAQHFARPASPDPGRTDQAARDERAEARAIPWAAIKAEADEWTAAQFDGGRVELESLGIALETLTKGARHHVQGLADAGVASAEEAAEGVALAFSTLGQLIARVHELRHGLAIAKKVRGKQIGGAGHPDFRAAAHAIESAEAFTRWSPDLDGGALRTAWHAMGDIQQGRKAELFRIISPVGGNSDGGATATARAFAICAMEARYQARQAGSSEPPAKEAQKVEACFRDKEHTAKKIATWHHKARAELEELAGLRPPPSEPRGGNRVQRQHLETFARAFLAPGASRTPGDAAGWYEVAEVYEARLREMTGADIPTKAGRAA